MGETMNRFKELSTEKLYPNGIPINKTIKDALKTHIRIQLQDANEKEMDMFNNMILRLTNSSVSSILYSASNIVGTVGNVRKYTNNVLDSVINKLKSEQLIISTENWAEFYKLIGYYIDDHMKYTTLPGKHIYSPDPIEGFDSAAFDSWMSMMSFALCWDRYGITGGMTKVTHWVAVAEYAVDYEELYDQLDTAMDGETHERHNQYDKLCDDDNKWMGDGKTPELAMIDVMNKIREYYRDINLKIWPKDCHVHKISSSGEILNSK